MEEKSTATLEKLQEAVDKLKSRGEQLEITELEE